MDTTDQNEEALDFYHKLRQKIWEWSQQEDNKSFQWTKWLLLAPDLFHLLIRLAADPDVPLNEKAKLAGVIAYFISPLDLIPELILGPAGYMDDIVLTIYALNSIVNTVDPAIVQKHWAGEGDVLEIIKNILHSADRMIGSGILKRLKRLFT